MSKADNMFHKIGYFRTDNAIQENMLAYMKIKENIEVWHYKEVYNKILDNTTKEYTELTTDNFIIFDLKNKRYIKTCYDYPDARMWVRSEEQKAINEKVKELCWYE